jgi:tetratricopeptide (TPR) repeat protein
MARSREIMAHVDTFCQEALPVIASLLPAEADLGTTVRLTALNDPAYFAYRSSLVMNTDTPAYLGRTSKFFNILGHEMLHIGYFDREPYQAEVWSEPYPAKVLPMVLQNDGLAVYTQYLLSSTYRAPLEIELVLLKNKLAVSFLIGRVNELLQEAGALPEEEILGTAYRGLSQRALYVVGAHMARTIDETLGRAALAETVRTGPRSFIRTYNRVAEPGQEIHEIPEPEDLSAIQVLRKAALAGDLQLVEEMIGVIGEAGVENPGGETFEPLVSAGLVLQRGQAPDLAVAVFELLVSLFPEHAEAHVYLGDAYSLVGEPEKARGAYQRAAEIDVRVAAARQGQ